MTEIDATEGLDEEEKPSGRSRHDAPTVIFNPVAGSAPDEDELRAELGDDVWLVPTTEDDPGSGQAARAVADGADVVVACGGDGTVRAVLESLVGTEATLGLLPFGTGNLLASNLGLPAGFAAFDTADDRVVRRIDTGRVAAGSDAEAESFAVMAGSGFDAEMMADASGSLKERIGTSAYVLSALRHLRDDLVPTRVDVDGTTWFEGRSAMVLVGNFGTISGGIDVFPDARPDDGRLEVLVLSAANLREWASVAWRIVRRRSIADVAAHRTSGTEITVSTASPRRWELDGDERPPATRLHFAVVPDSLAIVAASEGGHDA